MEYASNAKGNTAVALAGTALGGAIINGVVNWMQGQQKTEGDRPVTRYEMGLFQQINEKNNEITLLKANEFTTAQSNVLQQQINTQAVYNAQSNTMLGVLQQQIQSVTKLMVPNENLAPGYGRAFVAAYPAPPPPPLPWYPYPPVPPAVPPTTTQSGTTEAQGNG